MTSLEMVSSTSTSSSKYFSISRIKNKSIRSKYNSQYEHNLLADISESHKKTIIELIRDVGKSLILFDFNLYL
jgi:hypothetical protein